MLPSSARSGRSRRGDAAKRSLILAAERLIGDRGYRAVSLREIALAAGQRNNSAAQYHFGTKRGLVVAVLEYRMGPINEHRVAMLAEMDATGRSNDLRSLVEALMIPWLDAVGNPEQPTHYARFLSHVAFIPDFSVQAQVDPAYTSGLIIVAERIVQQMAHLPRRIAVQRAQMINRLMVSAMADQERTAHFAASWSRIAAPSDLVDLGVAMVLAPASERARAEAAAFKPRPNAVVEATDPDPDDAPRDAGDHQGNGAATKSTPARAAALRVTRSVAKESL